MCNSIYSREIEKHWKPSMVSTVAMAIVLWQPDEIRWHFYLKYMRISFSKISINDI